MKLLNWICVFIIGVAWGCEKENTDGGYSYRGYPTAYFKPEPSDLQKLEKEYFELNPFTKSGLNEFGFCGFEGSDLDRTIEYPPDPQFTGSLSKTAVMDFLSSNAQFTGVTEPDQMDFMDIDSTSYAWDGSRIWSFRSADQFYKGIEVYYSNVIFHLWHGKVRDCTGHWYPRISIPESFRIDSTSAKQKLIGRIASYYGWAGPYYSVISKSDLEGSSAKTVIFPVMDDNAIVLYVTWEIYLPAASYKFFIDVMSGKIVSEEPTIIS
jgi:hypothetical protein